MLNRLNAKLIIDRFWTLRRPAGLPIHKVDIIPTIDAAGPHYQFLSITGLASCSFQVSPSPLYAVHKAAFRLASVMVADERHFKSTAASGSSGSYKN